MRLCINTDSIDVDEKATTKENSPVPLWSNNNKIERTTNQSYSGYLSNVSTKSNQSSTADSPTSLEVTPKKKSIMPNFDLSKLFSWSKKENPTKEDNFLRTVKSFDTVKIILSLHNMCDVSYYFAPRINIRKKLHILPTKILIEVVVLMRMMR